MNCTLYIPHLIPAAEHGLPPWPAPQAPVLKSLLARATFSMDTKSDAETWLCTAFGIARQNDWPLASIMAAADGLPAQSGYWLRAIPAHLEPRRDALVLTDFTSLAINAQESAALAQTLASHLRGDGIALHAPASGRWYLQLPQAPSLQTFVAEAALGRDVREYLPQGADALMWHRVITEMQMLLHAHPVNEVREAHGLPTINSVWLSSGGTLPAPGASRFKSVFSGSSTICALALHSSTTLRALDACRVDLLGGTGDLLISVETLASPALRDDEPAWREEVHTLERDWIAPLASAQREKRIRTLTLISPNRAGVCQLSVSPWDTFKFWRKNKYL